MQNITDTWNLLEKPSGMDLVSEQLASLSHLDENEVKKRALEENSIVYGQVNLILAVLLFDYVILFTVN